MNRVITIMFPHFLINCDNPPANSTVSVSKYFRQLYELRWSRLDRALWPRRFMPILCRDILQLFPRKCRVIDDTAAEWQTPIDCRPKFGDVIRAKSSDFELHAYSQLSLSSEFKQRFIWQKSLRLIAQPFPWCIQFHRIRYNSETRLKVSFAIAVFRQFKSKHF